jgi:hypothetical protein
VNEVANAKKHLALKPLIISAPLRFFHCSECRAWRSERDNQPRCLSFRRLIHGTKSVSKWLKLGAAPIRLVRRIAANIAKLPELPSVTRASADVRY